MEAPAEMARDGAHEAVENILRSGPRGSLLDVPAGHGALSVRLSKLGFEVSACDLYPEIFHVDGTEIRAGNLDGTLPYDDASFDCVVCIEGLEHIENPANAIREFARLLRPGGTLVSSVPNIMNIEERLKWLFSGYTSHFKPLSTEARAEIAAQYGGIEEVALHVSPIGYSELRYLLEKNGFELDGVFMDKAKRNSWLFAPLALVIRLIAKLTPAEKRRSRWSDELNSDEVLLGGNTLIFKSKKL